MTKEVPSNATERASSALGQAWAYHTEGKDEQAIQEFERLLAKNPDNVDLLYGLGLSQKGAGHKEAAVQTFQRVIELLGMITTVDETEGNRVAVMTRMSYQQIAAIKEIK